jgi:probable rRNA maturation factor
MSRVGASRERASRARPRNSAAPRHAKRTTPVRHPTPAVEIVVASHLWSRQPGAPALLRRTISAAAAAVRSTGEVAVLLTDDASIRTLNRDWRRRNVPTNVLSFPAPAVPAARGATPLLGDIVIAYESTEREAIDEHKPFAHHLAHLAVHGFLHLVGYDHLDDEEAEQMERLEAAILARLDVPDPYAARAPATDKA